MWRPLLNRTLTRASAPEHRGFAARALPMLPAAVPCTAAGAELIRRLVEDERWAARYLVARAAPRLVPAALPVAEAWELELSLADDTTAVVRQGAAFGLGELALAAPEARERLERLLANPAAPAAHLRVALRSLVVLAVAPATAELAERLLRSAAQDESLARVAEIVITRGVAARDGDRARAILRAWAESREAGLRRRGARGLERLSEAGTA